MCCFAWPVKDIEYEAAPRYRNMTTGYRYQWNGRSWDLQEIQVPAGPQGVAVPFQAGPATGPILPIVAQQQPYQAQPMMIAGGVQAGQPVMMAAPGGGGGVPPGQPVLVNGGPAPMMGGVGGQPAFMMPGF